MSKNTDLSELINYVKGKTSGQLVAPFYTSVSSFTGTLAGYLAFDSSGNILSVSAPSSQWVTSGSNIYYNLGNVVIGGTSPKLDALNRTNLTINGISSTILTFGIGTAYASYMYSDSSLVEISTNTQPLAFTTNGAERLRILANGNVGINTSTPSYNLDVVGDINISGSYRINGVAIATNGVTGTGTTNYVPKWSSSSQIGNSLIYDNGTDILVGTTTNPYTGSNYRSVSVYATSRAIFSMSHASSSTVGMIFYQSSQLNLFNTSDSSGIKVVAGFSFGGVGVILNPGATSWSSTSDERLKTDIKPIEDGLNKVSKLRAITGRYKTDKKDTSRSFLIAQDVESVLPEAVNVNNEDGYLSLNYTDVIPLLVASIKELKSELDALKQVN